MKGKNASGDPVSGLNWIPANSLKGWSRNRMENACELILETTGESFNVDRLRNLPLDEKFGLWVLSDGRSDFGILWAMKLSNSCARVLAFSVSTQLQGKGNGAEGWRLFARAAKSIGIREVQLEVRQDNVAAITMYRHRGLRPKGFISGYYRGQDGWLMRGPLRIESSSQ